MTPCIVQLKASQVTQITVGLGDSQSIPSVSLWILQQLVQFELKVEYVAIGEEMSGNAVTLKLSEVYQIWSKLNCKFESY